MSVSGIMSSDRFTKRFNYFSTRYGTESTETLYKLLDPIYLESVFFLSYYILIYLYKSIYKSYYILISTSPYYLKYEVLRKQQVRVRY